MIRSFRLRFFLLASVIVASILALIMASGWSRAMSFETRRLDARLCSEAQRLAIERFAADEMPRLEKDIQAKLHLDSPAQLLLRLQSSAGADDYRSALWDTALAQQTLHWQAAGATPASPVATPDIMPPPTAAADAPPPNADPTAETPPGRAAAPGPTCALARFVFNGEVWHAARSVLPGATGMVAANLAAAHTEIRSALQDGLLLELGLALLLTALGAWLLSGLVMRPVNRLREAMKTVTPMALDQRLPDAGEDREFKELIAAYNTMLARLERNFQQAARFSADAAHELKTPLTILRGRLEQARRKADNSALEADLAELQDEVGRLSAIMRKLLLLSQADAGRLELNLVPVDVTELLDLLTGDAQMIVGDQQLHFNIARGLLIRGDAVLIRQMLNNLLSNALRYASGGGIIALEAKRSAGGVGFMRWRGPGYGVGTMSLVVLGRSVQPSIC
ncbi:MAG: histidine kinase dimerization/phospho-acceptor domain-containing protein [Rhodoferax sp.]